MPSKRQREQLSAARAASVEFFKKRRQEASSVHNLLHKPSVQSGTGSDAPPPRSPTKIRTPVNFKILSNHNTKG